MQNSKELASVNTFFRRVTKTFALVLLAGTAFLVILVYLPMSKELDNSLLSNFAQLSHMNEDSLEHIVHAGLDGSRSLSSRTMMKIALLDYLEGKMELEELREYVEPIYAETAMILENVQCARRIVDGVEISHYKAHNRDECVAVITEGLDIDYSKEQKFLATECNIYSIVVTPVKNGDTIIAYDELIFDISSSVESLNKENISIYLMKEEEYDELQEAGSVIYTDEETEIYKTPKCFVSVIKMGDGVYFATCQDQDIIMAPMSRVKAHVLMIGFVVLTVLLAVVQIYLVNYTKREFISFEMEQINLKKIADEANVDTLTKAGSRSGGQKYLEISFDEFLAKGKSSALLMIDIDNFKSINDAYGHASGDMILEEFVARIRKIIRTEDKIFRWGGDEFVGFFSYIDHSGIDRVVQKIFRTVSKDAFPVWGTEINVTISVGISFFKTGDQSYEDALQRADQAMYTAKNHKENAVSILL